VLLRYRETLYNVLPVINSATKQTVSVLSAWQVRSAD